MLASLTRVVAGVPALPARLDSFRKLLLSLRLSFARLDATLAAEEEAPCLPAARLLGSGGR
jgi:hypothetical protein